MTNSEPERYELKIQVQPTDIDQLGHVNNIVYLRWVQDAAVAHWRSAAPQADQEKLLWVVVRHEIDYQRPALPNEAVLARTWVGTATDHLFERHTELVRERDGKLLARARTLWCPIEPSTGRPTDVSDEVRERFSVPEPE